MKIHSFGIHNSKETRPPLFIYTTYRVIQFFKKAFGSYDDLGLLSNLNRAHFTRFSVAAFNAVAHDVHSVLQAGFYAFPSLTHRSGLHIRRLYQLTVHVEDLTADNACTRAERKILRNGCSFR